MQHCAQPDLVDFGIAHLHGFRDQRRVGRHFLRMSLCVVIFGVNGERQRSHRIQNGLWQCLRSRVLWNFLGHGHSISGFGRCKRFRELFQPLINLFECVRASGEQPFERHTEVRFQHVFFPFFCFARIEMVGG